MRGRGGRAGRWTGRLHTRGGDRWRRSAHGKGCRPRCAGQAVNVWTPRLGSRDCDFRKVGLGGVLGRAIGRARCLAGLLACAQWRCHRRHRRLRDDRRDGRLRGRDGNRRRAGRTGLRSRSSRRSRRDHWRAKRAHGWLEPGADPGHGYGRPHRRRRVPLAPEPRVTRRHPRALPERKLKLGNDRRKRLALPATDLVAHPVGRRGIERA